MTADSIPTAPYSLTRDEAAEQLQMSTRSVDRYIRKGKLRAKKIGKIVYIHEEDLRVIKDRGWQENFSEEILPSAQEMEIVPQSAPAPSHTHFTEFMQDFSKKLTEKDDVIQDLSYRLGKAEIELKNSIPLVDHKKVAFLLEDAKRNLDHERNEMINQVEDLQESLKQGKLINTLLFLALMGALITMSYMWYASL